MKDQASLQSGPTLGEIGLDNFPTYLMNRIMARYNATLQSQIRSLGLNTAKMRTLAVLSIVEAPLISELAVYSVSEISSLSRALDALEADGLVTRSVDPIDSRAVRVSITAEGRSTFAKVWPDMLASYEAMFEGISDEERHAFIGTLKKMLSNTRIHDF